MEAGAVGEQWELCPVQTQYRHSVVLAKSKH